MTQHPLRFVGLYIGLGVAAVAALLLAVLLALAPGTVRIATQSDLGPTTPAAIIAQAEKLNAQDAAAQGVTVLSQSVLSATLKDPNTYVIVLKTNTDAGLFKATVTLNKGLWQPTGLSAVPMAPGAPSAPAGRSS